MAILFVVYLTLFAIPRVTINQQIEKAYYQLNILFVSVMFGTIMCLSGMGPYVAKLLVRIWFGVFGRDGYL